MSGQIDTTHLMLALVAASVPSILVAAVAWIRLGPRVENLENTFAAHGIEVKATLFRQETEQKLMRDCLTRLTTLQEVAERRLERLESK